MDDNYRVLVAAILQQAKEDMMTSFRDKATAYRRYKEGEIDKQEKNFRIKIAEYHEQWWYSEDAKYLMSFLGISYSNEKIKTFIRRWKHTATARWPGKRKSWLYT